MCSFSGNLGFKRISFGIQDFDPKVQAAVNRIQPEAMLFEAMDWMREAGFESVNVDLIYGLPYQSLATFRDTIEKTLRPRPRPCCCLQLCLCALDEAHPEKAH
jgi:oxygen-independent coproporphyrinogen-3 oxidase